MCSIPGESLCLFLVVLHPGHFTSTAEPDPVSLSINMVVNCSRMIDEFYRMIMVPKSKDEISC